MHAYYILIARLVLAGMWLTAGFGKLAQKESRHQSITNFGLLPSGLARLVGTLLPWFELSLGVLLLLGLWSVQTSLTSLSLLLVFTFAIVLNLLRGRIIECHCFGQLSRAYISWRSVIRNGFLIALTMLILCGRTDYLSFDGWLKGIAVHPDDPPVFDFLPVIFMLASGFVFWHLATSAWQVAQTVATEEGGPSRGTAERKFLRRWMRLTEETSVHRRP